MEDKTFVNYMMRSTLLDDLGKTMNEAEDKLLCANEGEWETVNSIVNLVLKLAKLSAEVANNSEKIRATRLAEYLVACFNWGFIQFIDFDVDLKKFWELDYEADEEDDDEDIDDIINKVLEELRSK